MITTFWLLLSPAGFICRSLSVGEIGGKGGSVEPGEDYIHKKVVIGHENEKVDMI